MVLANVQVGEWGRCHGRWNARIALGELLCASSGTRGEVRLRNGAEVMGVFDLAGNGR
jgi:hypothetical protein